MDTSSSEGYKLSADFYDYVVPYAERQDVAFFVDMAKECGGPVLELGCGTGRVLIPTAREGIEIVGLDLSAYMLNICRERLENEEPQAKQYVELLEGDMTSFKLDKHFKLITIPFRPFQHLQTVEDQMACLNCIHDHLDDEGRLILDLFNPDLDYLSNVKVGKEFGDEPEFETPDGRKILRRFRMNAVDRTKQVNQCELLYYVTHRDGRKECVIDSFPFRYFFRYEVEHLLARCGFRVEQLYSDYDKSAFGEKYPGELIFVAVKA